MRLPLEAKECECLKLIYSDKLSCEEGTELVIPDTCADAGRILDVRAQTLLTSKRAVSEGVVVSASVEADVIFVTEEDESPRCISARLPFEFSAIAKGVDEESELTARLELCKLEARMLNPRKLLIRADVSADIRAYKEDIFMLWDDLPEAGETSVHMLKKEIEHSLVMGIGEKSFTVSDEYNAPNFDTGAQLVSCVTQLCPEDVKTVGNKLVFKAIAKTNAVFIKSDGEMSATNFETQFSQIIESETSSEGAEVDIILGLMSADFVMLPDREEGVIAANLKIGVQALCVSAQSAEFVADAYSNSYPLQIEKSQVSYQLAEPPKRQKLRLEGNLSNQQCDVIYIADGGISTQIDGGRLSFTVRASGIGQTEGGEKVALSATLRGGEALEMAPNQYAMVSGASCGNISTTHGGGAVLDVYFDLTVCARGEVEAICALELDEDAPIDRDSKPSMVVLCSPKSAGLWELAKKYGSTIEAIETANSLNGEFNENMRPLIIPKA